MKPASPKTELQPSNQLRKAVFGVALKKAARLWFSIAVLLAGGVTAVRAQSALDGFDPNANGAVLVVVVQPDGKILIGGLFSRVLGVTRNRIARLNPNGTLDTAFDPNATSPFLGSPVVSIAVQADGKILAGGNFTNIGGQARNRIARLDATTGAADSFDPNANEEVDSITVQADGKILAGGYFSSIGGQTRNRIARLDPITGLADSFNPNADGTVVSIALQADGKVLAGGWYTSIGGQPRNSIARLDPTTGLADSFDPNASGELPAVYSIVAQADGKILVGGTFTSIGGQARNHLARLDPTIGLADSFNPNAIGGRSFPVHSLAVQADGKILAGGEFTTIGGQPRNLFARLSNDTAALQNLAVTQTTITWTRGGSSPLLARVTFEYSTDNMNYTPLGDGTAAGSNWALTGLNLSTGVNFYIRARGHYRNGQHDGSESITESVRNAFLVADVIAPAFEFRITGMERDGNDLRLRFTSLAGRNYAIQSSANLSSGPWMTLPGTTTSGTGSIVQTTLTNALTQPQQFYRVLQLP